MSWNERGALDERAKAEGLTPSELVKRVFDERGSILGTAIQLGVAPNTVRYHLKKFQQEAAKQEPVKA